MPVPDFPPPADVEVAGGFWSGVAAGELRLPRCSGCGAWQWYPQETGHCPGSELEWTTLPGTGTVFTHTTVNHPFLPGTSSDDLPITVVVIEPDGAPGVRLVGNLAEGVRPVIGQPVVMETVEMSGGRRHPVFRPVEG